MLRGLSSPAANDPAVWNLRSRPPRGRDPKAGQAPKNPAAAIPGTWGTAATARRGVTREELRKQVWAGRYVCRFRQRPEHRNQQAAGNLGGLGRQPSIYRNSAEARVPVRRPDQRR